MSHFLSPKKKVRWFAAALGMLMSMAVDAADQPADLTDLSLEELMDVRVTSVAKRPQALLRTSAAVFVITREDIRRSGVTTVPEALRMAPGVQVAKVDANKWAISARGFNGNFSNKLLVLIDSRSVYTPLFSGVYWDSQDVMLEDIERIEVIRGPGATLWGANAVNGVINVITRTAKDTAGGLISLGGGTEERAFVAARYGMQLSDKAFLRLYIKGVDRDGSVDSSGNDTQDDWDQLRGGFRLDLYPSDRDHFTVQGDLYTGDYGGDFTLFPGVSSPPLTLEDTSEIAGGNAMLRWERQVTPDSAMALKAYYDRAERDSAIFDQAHDTLEMDFQHRSRPLEAHLLTWGLGYRSIWDDIQGRFITAVEPSSRRDDLFSAFIQDEIELMKDRLWLTLGTKAEHNDYTGFEFQPNTRLLWSPSDQRYALWGAVSRAVRTPSRAEHDIRLPVALLPAGAAGSDSPPMLVELRGDDSFESEEVLAYELGCRMSISHDVSIDLALFCNTYDNLRTLEMGDVTATGDPEAPFIIPVVGDNLLKGESRGLEVGTEWHMTDWWRWKAAYTLLDLDLTARGGSRDADAEDPEDASPQNQVSLRASLDLFRDVEFDAWLRYTDSLPSLDIDSYLTLDLKLGWSPTENLELSVVGQNLLDEEHPEFIPEFISSARRQVERGVYGKMTLSF